jgi:dipeptidyl aminopeptidase/acylaminoacyl peptidase
LKRITLTLAAVCLVATSLVAQTKRPLMFDDLMKVRRVGAPQISPDGKWVAYDLSTIDFAANRRKSAVYLMPSMGGVPMKISEGERQDESPSWSPDGKTLSYISNKEGGAKQLYLYDVAAKSTVKASDVPNGVGTYIWMPKGDGFVFVSDVYTDCGVDANCTKEAGEKEEKSLVKARVIEGLLYRHWASWQPSTRAHILTVDRSGKLRDLTPGKLDAPHFSLGGGDEFDISPDGKELVYAQNTDPEPSTSTNSDIFIVPFAGGGAKRLTTGRGADTGPRYSPDGKWIAFRSQARAGYESDLWELMLYNRQTGALTKVAPAYNNYVDSIEWAPDSRAIIFSSGERGRSAIYEVSIPKGTPKRLYYNASAAAVTISNDGKRLYFERNSLNRPNEIFSIARNGKEEKQLTHENDALFANIEMGAVSELVYDGAAGAKVQSWLIKPPAFDATKKYPAIVLIHGGPQGAWGDGWSYRWNAQMFASRGYVVFMPNPRGSTGFGQKFVEEISGDWGGKVYTDIMNGVDQVAALPYVDQLRMGAAGGSYGGYMVNWILGHTDRFKALVSHAGVYNLESMAGVTEEQWFTDWEFQGTPWDNPEQYEKWSPHRFAKHFKTPTLVVHGELDFRVPIGEGMQLYTTLQRRNVPSKLLYFPDEGHWILKPQNSELWYRTVLGWMDQWLKK